MLNSKYWLILAGHVIDTTMSGHVILACKSILRSLLDFREITTRDMRLPWMPAGTTAAGSHNLKPAERTHFETG